MVTVRIVRIKMMVYTNIKSYQDSGRAGIAYLETIEAMYDVVILASELVDDIMFSC